MVGGSRWGSGVRHGQVGSDREFTKSRGGIEGDESRSGRRRDSGRAGVAADSGLGRGRLGRILGTGCFTSMILIGPGCEEPPILGDLQYEGIYFDVYASEGIDICKGTYPALERFAGDLIQVGTKYDMPVRTDKSTYYWVSADEWEQTPGSCPANAGCTIERRKNRAPWIYSRFFSLHEVVHAKIRPALYSHAVFAEGLAVSLDNHLGSHKDYVVESLDFGELIARGGEDILDDDYARAGYLVRSLLDGYPTEIGMAMDAVYFDMDANETREKLRANGIDFDDAQMLLDASPSCATSGFRLDLPECSDARETVHYGAPEGDETLVFSSDLDCDSVGVAGSREGERHRTMKFSLSRPRAVTMALHTSSNVVARVGRCGRKICESVTQEQSESEILVRAEQSVAMDLTAGEYWVTFEQKFATSDVVEDGVSRFAFLISPREG